MTDTVRVPRCMVVKLHRFLAALCDGSPLHVPGSRFLLTDNPAFTEDNGEDPRILIDVQDWMLAASPQGEGDCVCVQRGDGPEGCGLCNETGSVTEGVKP